MYLGDIEVFRTSTAEPTEDGIAWTWVKEMQQYNSLWRHEQKIIFDLGNLLNDLYTGVWHTTLTATFFTVPDSPVTADQILPISKRMSSTDQPSAFTLPEDVSAHVPHVLPRNVYRAVVSISACGQAAEEFWYQNVLDSLEATFSDTAGLLGGGGPWREVQLLIDGQLAGVAWPFPIIFTGGINPGLWRPIAGIDAFDLREQEIDITPWLPVLLDGDSHWFEIRVARIIEDGKGGVVVKDSTASNWVVTGKIFLFLDAPDSITTGTPPKIVTPEPRLFSTLEVTQNATGVNETLTLKTVANRQIAITSTITSARGTYVAAWTQSLDFANTNNITAFGHKERTEQSTGIAASSASGYALEATYPLVVEEVDSSPGAPNVSIEASILRGLTLSVSGPAVFPNGLQPGDVTGNRFKGSSIDTTQNGSASYFADPTGNVSTSSGTTVQDFKFRGLPVDPVAKPVDLYSRRVRAVNWTVVDDEQTTPKGSVSP